MTVPRSCRSLRLWVASLTLLQWLPAAASGRSPVAKVRVLLLSGQNNHDWKSTSPALKRVLEESGRFAVDVTEHPEQCTAASLARYSVIVSNWNAFGDAAVKEWPEATRAAMLGFVRGGKGLVVVHAGGSSFYDWREYQQMVGTFWDMSRTGHGAQHAFFVQVTDPSHPVTHGLRIFLTRDELWHRTGLGSGAAPIASAFSAAETGGSGQDEPVALVSSFGKGRTFSLVLGHDAAAMQSAGFGALLCRGAEWAATGKVTLPPPASFLDAAQLDLVLGQVRGYKAGDRREPLWMLEYHAGRLAGTPPAAALAARLAALAADAGATPDGRQAACRTLALVGTNAEVPVLARLLDEPTLATFARMALERIPGPQALSALRTALARSSGPARAGIVNSLGVRRDAASVPTLAALTGSADAATAAAALAALGRIGTPEALAALDHARPASGALRFERSLALVKCADGLAARGHAAQALRVYRSMLRPANAAAVRSAAFTGLVRVDKAGRAALLLGALRGADAALRRAAGTLLGSDAAALRAAASQVERLPADVQPLVLAAIAARGERSALAAVSRAASSNEPAVRLAALGALGALGGAAEVPVLAGAAASADASIRGAARAALERLSGAGTDLAIAAAAKAQPAAQREMIRVIVARSARSAVPALIRMAERQPAARSEAAAAIGALGAAGDIGALLRVLAAASDEDRGEVEAAVAALCSRSKTTAAVRAALATAAGPVRVSLLNVLGAVGGRDALPLLRGALKSDDPQQRQAAVRALAGWPDAEPLGDLLAAAKVASDGVARTLALRGVAQLASLGKDQPEKTVAALREALAVAATPDERKALVSALGKAPCLDALTVASAGADEEAVRDEAALAALQVAGAIWRRHKAEAEAVARRFASSTNAELSGRAAAVLSNISRAENLASGATATNLDGLYPDGAGSGPQAAIDGDPATYWDEVDNQKLYAIEVRLAEPAVVSVLRIQGHVHHQYAPRDFEVLLDGKLVKTVENAQYTANWLQVDLPPTRCSTVGLRITGYYGQSPAIRELGIYSRLPAALGGK